jgi:hypothetical protein
MITPGSASPLLLSTGGYQIQNSLRFRASNSAYLSRTFGSPTDGKKFTLSWWMKRGTVGTAVSILSAINVTSTFSMQFSTQTANGDADYFRVANPNAGTTYLYTDAVFRDPSAWYHFVFVFDSANATASDRAILYCNGTRLSATVSVTLNATSRWNESGATARIGLGGAGFASVKDYFDGHKANFYMIDGQALTPSSFGQTDATTGVWVPKAYSGTYGTNGFFLQFKDATSTTTIGYDTSGNSNNFTTSGISVTSGTTFDQMLDTPTLNYAVMNPLDLSGTAATFQWANLQVTRSGASQAQAYCSIQMSSGKWYCEMTAGADVASLSPGIIVGTANAAANRYLGQDSFTYGYDPDGRKVNSGTYTAYGNTWTAGDIIGIILDADNGKLYFSKNGTVQNSGDPVAGTNAAFTGLTGPYRFAASLENGGIGDFNFGQRAFSTAPPSGFKALNTANLSVPSIKKPSLYMDATLRTGTGATASVSSLGFQPDLVWIKSRSAATNNNLFDSARGATIGLVSQNVNPEYTDANSLTAFNSNGYSLGSDASSRGVNINTNTYVDWAWKEGATPGFDIVLYTGNGANRTVSHALGAAPACYVVKGRSGTNVDEWFMYHKVLGATKYIRWSQALGSYASSTFWQDTAPTSSVFSLGTNISVNTNTTLYVAYLWSEIDGFSKFGSYTGNASSDGPFVFCGFRPRWIYIKGDNATSGRQYDTARLTNEAKSPLYFNLASAESAEANGIDILSNGFKVRWSDSVINGSGTTYIFMAFAEAPFKYARAR